MVEVVHDEAEERLAERELVHALGVLLPGDVDDASPLEVVHEVFGPVEVRPLRVEADDPAYRLVVGMDARDEHVSVAVDAGEADGEGVTLDVVEPHPLRGRAADPLVREEPPEGVGPGALLVLLVREEGHRRGAQGEESLRLKGAGLVAVAGEDREGPLVRVYASFALVPDVPRRAVGHEVLGGLRREELAVVPGEDVAPGEAGADDAPPRERPDGSLGEDRHGPRDEEAEALVELQEEAERPFLDAVLHGREDGAAEDLDGLGAGVGRGLVSEPVQQVGGLPELVVAGHPVPVGPGEVEHRLLEVLFDMCGFEFEPEGIDWFHI